MINIDYYSLGLKIKKRRKELKYTQEQLSELCDISTGFLCHIEAGTRILSLETLYKIAISLKISIDYLILDTALEDNNFIQHIAATVQNKSAKKYKNFCNIIKILAENIDEM